MLCFASNPARAPDTEPQLQVQFDAALNYLAHARRLTLAVRPWGLSRGNRSKPHYYDYPGHDTLLIRERPTQVQDAKCLLCEMPPRLVADPGQYTSALVEGRKGSSNRRPRPSGSASRKRYMPSSRPANSSTPLHELLTICIKHTSSFEQRRAYLALLVQSIRALHGEKLQILVADDGAAMDHSTLQMVEVLRLPMGAGLSYGRNVLVRATRTPFFLLIDDDVQFDQEAQLRILVDLLLHNPDATIAAGCYLDRHGRKDCFASKFVSDEVHVSASSISNPGCGDRVHMVHNFFVGRTSHFQGQQISWDPRQRMMEHETFFYQLFLRDVPVLVCPSASLHHQRQRNLDYSRKSLRFEGYHFLQYFCKNVRTSAPCAPRTTTIASRTWAGRAWAWAWAWDGGEDGHAGGMGMGITWAGILKLTPPLLDWWSVPCCGNLHFENGHLGLPCSDV